MNFYCNHFELRIDGNVLQKVTSLERMTSEVYNLLAKVYVKMYVLWQYPAVTKFFANFVQAFYIENIFKYTPKSVIHRTIPYLYCKYPHVYYSLFWYFLR